MGVLKLIQCSQHDMFTIERILVALYWQLHDTKYCEPQPIHHKWQSSAVARHELYSEGLWWIILHLLVALRSLLYSHVNYQLFNHWLTSEAACMQQQRFTWVTSKTFSCNVTVRYKSVLGMYITRPDPDFWKRWGKNLSNFHSYSRAHLYSHFWWY